MNGDRLSVGRDIVRRVPTSLAGSATRCRIDLDGWKSEVANSILSDRRRQAFTPRLYQASGAPRRLGGPSGRDSTHRVTVDDHVDPTIAPGHRSPTHRIRAGLCNQLRP